MKTFDELTDAEVLALTDAEIERYIDLECARAGVPLLPPEPGPKPEEPAAEKDVTLYEVGGDLFRDQETALRVAGVINEAGRVRLDYIPGPGFTRIVGGADEPVSVQAVAHYSAARWDEVKAAVHAYEEAKGRWDAENSEYNKALSARRKSVEWVWDRIHEVREGERRRERYLSLLRRYIDLADGDEVLARKFLLDSEPEAAKYLPEGEEEL